MPQEAIGFVGLGVMGWPLAPLVASAQSRALDLHGQRVFDGNHKAGFRVELQRKDLKTTLDTGSASGAPLPATPLIQQLCGVLDATSHGDLDNSSLALLTEEIPGLGQASV